MWPASSLSSAPTASRWYDVNTNTNYNPDAETRAGIAGTPRSGMGALAAWLGDRLAQTQSRAA